MKQKVLAILRPIYRTLGLSALYWFLRRAQRNLPVLAARGRSSLRHIRRALRPGYGDYGLTPLSEAHLAAMLAVVTGKSNDELLGYIRELNEDSEFRRQIQEFLATCPYKLAHEMYGTGEQLRYCERTGWYAAVRALKPALVVETGVFMGLGSCVLTHALKKNAAEGFPGRFIGIDTNPESGSLFKGSFAEWGELRIGSSDAVLQTIDRPIDLLISDSMHAGAYEQIEYRAMAPKLAPGALVIGSSNRKPGLLGFSEETGRQYLVFDSQAQDYWTVASGITFSFTHPAQSRTASKAPA
jgi:hypothetical protein